MVFVLDFENPVYFPPMQGPLYWQDERKGKLKDTIVKYFDWMSDKEIAQPTEEEFKLIKAYCKYWIEAPCWQGANLDSLRQEIKEAKTFHDLNIWLTHANQEGIDPF